MKVKFFYICLDKDDFLIKNPPNSEFPFSVSNIVSDFNFQTDYFSHYIEKELKLLNFEHSKFNMIMIKLRKNPKEKFYIEEHNKCLTIEVFFDEKKYNKIYPSQNKYPLKNLLIPILDKNKFNKFLFNTVFKSFEIAKKQNAPIPFNQLIDILLDFKNINFKNVWVHKTKLLKEIKTKVVINFEKNCNYFLSTISFIQNSKEKYSEEILKTLPRTEFYNDEIKDIKISNNKLYITKKNSDKYLCEFELDEITKLTTS